MKTWVPTVREVPGLLMVSAIGAAALVIESITGSKPYLSEVIVAIVVGAIILNTPLGARIGLRNLDGPFDRGLSYVGMWVLRLAIILMGLKVQTELFNSDQALMVGSVMLFALPSALLLTHFVTGRLGLRPEMGDLISIGTMICGASAINALSPVVFARRRDQGLAISAVFVFSLAALLLFLPVGRAVGLPDEFSGLWAGLAVNDLSSSVAVGSQFSDDAGLIATATKSLRILLLGPMLLMFSLLRRSGRSTQESNRLSQISQHLPLFIVGYLLFFGVRLAGDAAFGGTEAWGTTLSINDQVVTFLIVCVCAGIGLRINLTTIVEIGWKAVVAGACGSIGMAGVSLVMLLFFARNSPWLALTSGVTALIISYGLYRLGRLILPQTTQLRHRLASRAPLSLRETVELFEYYDSEEDLTPAVAKRILRQVYPVIGELQPLRESAILPPINYRRAIYWESKKGNGSLVGIQWTAGTRAHIHSHNCIGLGKNVEGQLDITHFDRLGENRLCLTRRDVIYPNMLMELDGPNTIHAVSNPSGQDAIDIHFYGPPLGEVAARFLPRGKDGIESLQPGAEVAVSVETEELPGKVVDDGAWRDATRERDPG